MELIASNLDTDIARLLDAFEWPAILVANDYRILATNSQYLESFGAISGIGEARCYQVSHGYDRPCDQAGESCPLAAATLSGRKERVLHIHQTPRGREHVDVELLPITGDDGRIKYFVELLKPLPIASAQSDDTRLVGGSRAFSALLEMVARVGPSDASVLLVGESGTGKEMVAKAIHDSSQRSGRPLVTLECAGLTESLFESEMFGHVKGAFTGANYAREGLVASADGGTLFLDEIGDIPYALQVKLLRLLETGVYRPVGSSQPRRTDFRLVCATHRDLRRMVEEGSFRLDLYYRINVFPIRVPSLSERVEDIPLIARVLLGKISPDISYHLTAPAMTLLKRHGYRGNIRELRNILARAVVLSNGNVIEHDTVTRCLEVRHEDHQADITLRQQEREYLHGLMGKYQGDKNQVAAIAGISLRTLYRKLE
jgi:DNA-binding NtrC family response regulator